MPLREPISELVTGQWEHGVLCTPCAHYKENGPQHCYCHHVCFACFCPAWYAIRQRRHLLPILDEPYQPNIGFACCCTTLYSMENRYLVQTRFDKANTCLDDCPCVGCIVTMGFGIAGGVMAPMVLVPAAAAAATAASAGLAAMAACGSAGSAVAGAVATVAGVLAACGAAIAGAAIGCVTMCGDTVGCDCEAGTCCCQACSSTEGAYNVCCCCCAFCCDSSMNCSIWQLCACYYCIECFNTWLLITTQDIRDTSRRRKESGCCACWETSCDIFYACAQLPFCACMLVQQQIEIDLREENLRQYDGINPHLIEYLPSWQQQVARDALDRKLGVAAPTQIGWQQEQQVMAGIAPQQQIINAVAVPAGEKGGNETVVGRPTNALA